MFGRGKQCRFFGGGSGVSAERWYFFTDCANPFSRYFPPLDLASECFHAFLEDRADCSNKLAIADGACEDFNGQLSISADIACEAETRLRGCGALLSSAQAPVAASSRTAVGCRSAAEEPRSDWQPQAEAARPRPDREARALRRGRCQQHLSDERRPLPAGHLCRGPTALPTSMHYARVSSRTHPVEVGACSAASWQHVSEHP